jgi:hypothetical protein
MPSDIPSITPSEHGSRDPAGHERRGQNADHYPLFLGHL